MNQDTIIKVSNISKAFRIPQERRDTIREHVVGFRKKMVYETFNALQDITFEVKRGEFFSIIGRNGSGKSTLLKILAGIYSPDQGSVIVNGEMSPFLELGVGFNPELSGKDNIYLNGTILGLSKFEIDRNYQKIVNFSELNRFIHLKVKNYSSGMQVRLAFSVAIHAEKEILLMDEVLAVGDANFQVKCFNVFEEFIKRGKTIIFVSHDPASVQKYSDRVLYLESSKAAFIGTATEALSKYMYTDVIKESDSIQGEQPDQSHGKSAEGNWPDEIAGHEAPVAAGGEEMARIVQITEVEIVDDEGLSLEEVPHGEVFSIRVYYNLLCDMTDLVFGIIIYDLKKRALFTTNTFSENVKTGKIQGGSVVVRFRVTNFLSAGKYMISVIACDKTQRVFYDWRDEVKAFRVYNPKRLMTYGGVDLPHDISLEKF